MPQPELVGPSTPDQVATFLATYVPSNNSRSLGRFFVCRADNEVELPAAEQSYRSRFNDFKSEATAYETEMTEQCEVIAEHAPTRGNKSLGTKSQKELREKEHAKFHHHIRTLAAKYDITKDEIDDAWKRTVEELAAPDGRLAAAGATYAKVSAYSDNFPFTISIFLDDVTDVVGVETVFRIATEQCGFVPGSFKSDAMSILGISSKHPSKIAVSTYTKTSFMTTAESKAAVEQYKLRGPAASISPLSGPPAAPAIDWGFTFNPFGDDDQGTLDDDVVVDDGEGGAAPRAKQAVKVPGKGKKKTPAKKKKGRKASSDDEESDGAFGYTPARPTRRAAQKAAEILHQAAEESNASRASAVERRAAADGGEGEEESPAKAKASRRRKKKADDDDGAWKPDPEDFGGGKRFRLY
ncbi:hypothetical protein JCM6882_007060 [Rhodosporidiobolus microsporus]